MTKLRASIHAHIVPILHLGPHGIYFSGHFCTHITISKKSTSCPSDAPCPSGWLTISEQDHSNCYYISNTTANFDEAHNQCNQLSFPTTSYLVAFNTKKEVVSKRFI